MPGGTLAACLPRVMVVAFLLNAVWEFAQLPAFEGMMKVPFTAHLVFGGGAVLLDALFIGGVYLGISLWFKDPRWIENRRSRGYGITIVLGAAAVVIIEQIALAGNWWRYSPYMPTILGVGLLPLAQLTTLTPLSCWIVGRYWK